MGAVFGTELGSHRTPIHVDTPNRGKTQAWIANQTKKKLSSPIVSSLDLPRWTIALQLDVK